MKTLKIISVFFLCLNFAQAIELRTYSGYMSVAEMWRSGGQNSDLTASDLEGVWVRVLNEYTYAGCQNPNNNALLAYAGDNEVLKIERSTQSKTRVMVTVNRNQYVTTASLTAKMIEYKMPGRNIRMIGIIDRQGHDKLLMTDASSTNIDGHTYNYLRPNGCPNFKVYERF